MATGMLSQGLDTAASLLGREFLAARRALRSVHSAGWHQQKDAAFAKAIEQVKPNFIHVAAAANGLQGCVLEQDRGMCKECARTGARIFVDSNTSGDQRCATKSGDRRLRSADKFKSTIVGTCRIAAGCQRSQILSNAQADQQE